MTSLENSRVCPTSASRLAAMGESFYVRAGKRWLDAFGSLTGLILLSPLMVFIAVVVKLTSPGPAFFRQVRVGQFGKPFRIIKFRTMVENADRRGPAVTAGGDLRITGVGRWMRKTKVDELPQLWNVLVGDMSLVGPRPEVPEFASAYTEEQRRIFLAKPGMTGPAANAYVREEELLAKRREDGSFYITTILPRKLELDLLYCGDIRFANDVKWILRTLANLFERSITPRVSQLRASDK